MESVLQAKDITKTFFQGKEKIEILKGVNLEVKSGQKLAIVGESGSGKSTLLHICAMLDKQTGGEIILLNKNSKKITLKQKLQARQRDIGFIYQQSFLLSDFSALENILMPAKIACIDKKTASKKAINLLEKIGLKDRMKNRPSQLSGGEKQRVAIARAVINNPKIIFADEPTGNLDSKNSLIVSNLLFSLVKEEQTALMLITHNKELAQACDKVYSLKEGRLT